MKQNIIAEKTFDFAIKIVHLCRALNEQREYVLSRQLLKSGTSIGANVEEAIGAISRPEFISKMQIAYKEARESHYWLRLLLSTNTISEGSGNAMMQDADELMKIIAAILKSSKG